MSETDHFILKTLKHSFKCFDNASVKISGNANSGFQERISISIKINENYCVNNKNLDVACTMSKENEKLLSYAKVMILTN